MHFSASPPTTRPKPLISSFQCLRSILIFTGPLPRSLGAGPRPLPWLHPYRHEAANGRAPRGLPAQLGAPPRLKGIKAEATPQGAVPGKWRPRRPASRSVGREIRSGAPQLTESAPPLSVSPWRRRGHGSKDLASAALRKEKVTHPAEALREAGLGVPVLLAVVPPQ